MNWEDLTAADFEKAAADCGQVCLLPIGVIEKHGDHLPMGMDLFEARGICAEASKIEPALVFPPYYFGHIHNSKHQPGSIAVKFELLLPLLESVCDEISRNGLKKIIIVNGHGGNVNMLNFFSEMLLDREKDYVTFIATTFMFPQNAEETAALSSKIDGHGGESETSEALRLFPELVKANTPGDYGASLERLSEYSKAGLMTRLCWYANHPGQLSCDQTAGSAEKGKIIVESRAAKLAEMIKLVKSDDTPMKLYQRYLAQSRNPTVKNSAP
jgi:creatinine amidohydrolase